MSDSENLTKAEITFEDFEKVDIRVGTVLSWEPVPKSKKLLKLEVDFGPSGTRTILAGIASIEKKESFLVGSRVLAVLNLAPRQMMGLTSHGMILAGHDDTLGLWLASIGPVPNGTRIG
jgi:methionyl-tRNA synthetase